MANREHLALLLKRRKGELDYKGWNRWRAANRAITPDLKQANLGEVELWPDTNLSKADLSEANLFEADFEEIRLRGAKLEAADLRYARLGGSDLRNADLRFSDLTGTDLRNADLSGADLTHVTFVKTKLSGANLEEAAIAYTIFANCDLKGVKGLRSIRHEGPSTIGTDTLFMSEGRIPWEFLQGAGVPDILLSYIPSLMVPGAIQFYSCFISYSTKDQEFADRLHADLQNKGARCWFAPHDVQGGKKLHEQIDEAIRRYEKLLLIVSASSMASEWVKTEIRKPRKRERAEKTRVLFPVRLVGFEAIRDWELFDADEGKDLAGEIREYYIPDFSSWKEHDAYQREFEKLLRDLRTEEAKEAAR